MTKKWSELFTVTTDEEFIHHKSNDVVCSHWVGIWGWQQFQQWASVLIDTSLSHQDNSHLHVYYCIGEGPQTRVLPHTFTIFEVITLQTMTGLTLPGLSNCELFQWIMDHVKSLSCREIQLQIPLQIPHFIMHQE